MEQAFGRVVPAEEALRRAEAAAGVSIDLTGVRHHLPFHSLDSRLMVLPCLILAGGLFTAPLGL